MASLRPELFITFGLCIHPLTRQRRINDAAQSKIPLLKKRAGFFVANLKAVQFNNEADILFRSQSHRQASLPPGLLMIRSEYAGDQIQSCSMMVFYENASSEL